MHAFRQPTGTFPCRSCLLASRLLSVQPSGARCVFACGTRWWPACAKHPAKVTLHGVDATTPALSAATAIVAAARRADMVSSHQQKAVPRPKSPPHAVVHVQRVAEGDNCGSPTDTPTGAATTGGAASPATEKSFTMSVRNGSPPGAFVARGTVSDTTAAVFCALAATSSAPAATPLSASPYEVLQEHLGSAHAYVSAPSTATSVAGEQNQS